LKPTGKAEKRRGSKSDIVKIFVTGHLGYIGTHLVQILKSQGHEVCGCDLNLFPESAWEKSAAPDAELIKDFRKLSIDELKGFDALIHLAAISNDPMGDLDQEITYSVNLHGTADLAAKARKAGIPRFYFSGSCSVYGKGVSLDLDETAEMRPVSAYAISKVEAEKALMQLASEQFCPVFLRNSTAYGYSDNFRVDLVVNNLLGCAFTRGDIRIMSDGTPWRPLIHCRDIARAFVAMLNEPVDKIRNLAVNIGANEENFQVKDVAANVQKLIPSASVVFTGEVGNDPRNYRVNFDLLGKILPEFRLEYSLEKGMKHLHQKFCSQSFSLKDFEGDRFTRLKILKHKLHLLNTL
jgi:nucleoside-diphosphate-sugar epimerase